MHWSSDAVFAYLWSISNTNFHCSNDSSMDKLHCGKCFIAMIRTNRSCGKVCKAHRLGEREKISPQFIVDAAFLSLAILQKNQLSCYELKENSTTNCIDKPCLCVMCSLLMQVGSPTNQIGADRVFMAHNNQLHDYFVSILAFYYLFLMYFTSASIFFLYAQIGITIISHFTSSNSIKFTITASPIPLPNSLHTRKCLIAHHIIEILCERNVNWIQLRFNRCLQTLLSWTLASSRSNHIVQQLNCASIFLHFPWGFSNWDRVINFFCGTFFWNNFVFEEI